MAFPHIETEAYIPVTKADLNRQIQANQAALLPTGCDYQGQNNTRPDPDDCCTELGADPQATAVFWSVYLALALVAVVASCAALI